MLTKKDYIAIAAAIKAQRPSIIESGRSYSAGRNVALNDVAIELSVYFARENAKFDYSRFLAACGVNH